MRSSSFRLGAAVWLFGTLSGVCLAADPARPAGWRTDGNGAYPHARPPLEWSQTHNVVWATPMPSKSNSQPAIAGDRLFVCAEPDWLLCLRLSDGEVLWQQSNSYREVADPEEWARAERELASAAVLESRRKELEAQLENLAAAAPPEGTEPDGRATQVETLTRQVTEIEAELKTLPLAEKWRTLGTHEKMNGYTTATPVTDGRRVWAVFGNAVVACYDLDGRRTWIQKLRDRPHAMFGHSASPLLVDGRLIVTVEDTVALDAATGTELWRTRYGQSWGSPIRVDIGNEPFIALANGRLLRAADGQVVARAFNLADGSPIADGRTLYYIQSRGGAVRLPETPGDKLELERLWETDPKGGKHYASPVLHNGLLYTVSGTGIYSVIDAATGAIVLEKRLNPGRGTMYPSVVLAGEHLLLSSDNGTTLVVKTGPTYEEVARNELEPFISTPIVHEDRIYVRTFGTMYCIGR